MPQPHDNRLGADRWMVLGRDAFERGSVACPPAQPVQLSGRWPSASSQAPKPAASLPQVGAATRAELPPMPLEQSAPEAPYAATEPQGVTTHASPSLLPTGQSTHGVHAPKSMLVSANEDETPRAVFESLTFEPLPAAALEESAADSRPSAQKHSAKCSPEQAQQDVPRVLCIYLPELALEAYTRGFPARRRTALAITSAPGPAGHVLCANACARAAGIVPGLRNAQASGLSEAIDLVGYPAEEIAALGSALNQALYQHTPQIEWLGQPYAERRQQRHHDAGASETDGPWATATGAAVLWAGLDGLGADLSTVLHTVHRLLAICTDFDLSWRAALGFHRYHTLASSLDAGELKVFASPEAALSDAKRTRMDALLQAWALPTYAEASTKPRAAGSATPKHTRSQAPKKQAGGSPRAAQQRATQWLLAKLKVESLGEFMALSPHAVRMGLGASAHRMQCALLEADTQPIATYLPPTEARFGLDFEPYLTRFQEAYPALQTQLAILLARLFKHSRTLTGLQLTLKQADHPAHTSTLRLAEPTLNGERVMALVTVHCETLVLKSPLIGLEVCAEHVPFAWVQTQLLEEAFEGDARPQVARASVLRALDRITALYGHQSFQRAALVPAHPPEARFTWDTAKPMAATGPQRPVRPPHRATATHAATLTPSSTPPPKPIPPAVEAVPPLTSERTQNTHAHAGTAHTQLGLLSLSGRSNPVEYPAEPPADHAMAPLQMLRRLLPRPWPLPSSLSEALWQRVHTATHTELTGNADTATDTARSVWGPFRLSDRWWERTALRDYYYLRTDDESWLWLFRERVTGRWYLHGWLD